MKLTYNHMEIGQGRFLEYSVSTFRGNLIIYPELDQDHRVPCLQISLEAPFPLYLPLNAELVPGIDEPKRCGR